MSSGPGLLGLEVIGLRSVHFHFMIKMYPWKSPHNESKRYYPILNDRIFWRKLDFRSYVGMGYQQSEFNKFYLYVFSSTDLLKGNCDDIVFESRIKCMQGKKLRNLKTVLSSIGVGFIISRLNLMGDLVELMIVTDDGNSLRFWWPVLDVAYFYIEEIINDIVTNILKSSQW